MTNGKLKIVVCGLSITSTWGNSHAGVYRALLGALQERGHTVLFLERDAPWYAEHRDLAGPLCAQTRLYSSAEELRGRFALDVAEADLVIIGSHVPDGIEVGRWASETACGMTAFYDLDTPMTIGHVARGDCEYLTGELIAAYDVYLSVIGGPILEKIAHVYGAQAVKALYCSVDASVYRPMPIEREWDLGFLGAYRADRQRVLEELFIRPAHMWPEGWFAVAGPQYPRDMAWPQNVDRIQSLPQVERPAFYNSLRFALNPTRSDMAQAGWCPSARILEAAACGVPVISDKWEGLDSFFRIGSEIHVAGSAAQVVDLLRKLPESQRLATAERARARVLASHTADRRAAELEGYARESLDRGARRRKVVHVSAAGA
jgi:spore maturation protein CgeB